MVFLSWFLSLLVVGLFVSSKYFFVYKRDKSLFKEYLLSKRSSFIILASTSFVFALIFFFVFPRMNWIYGMLYFIAFNIILYFVPFKSIWEGIKNDEGEKRAKQKIIVSSLLLVGILFEGFYFNRKAFRMNSPSYDISSLSMNASIKGNYGLNDDGDLVIGSGSYIIIENTEADKKNIRLTFSNAKEATIEAKVYYTLDEVNFVQTGTYRLNGVNENYNVISLGDGSCLEGVKAYRIDFSLLTYFYASSNTVTLHSLTFNSPLNFYFSPLRFGLYSFSIIFFAYLPYFIKKSKSREPNKIPYFVIGGMAVAFLIAVNIIIFSNISSYATSYPISQADLNAHYGSSTGKTDIFVALFDAFRKGRIDLDLEVDPRLLSIADPWNPSSRNAANATYYWDHAFYGGKYYCYYGPAPVILISFPFYLLSGCKYVLTAFGLEVIGMAFLIPAFLFLLLEIFRLIQKKVCWRQYILFSFIGLFTTMMISAITFKDGSYHEAIYHVPDIYGLAFFDLFFTFVLRAYRESRFRSLQLGLAAFFFVCLVFTRPNLFLALILAVPFLLSLLFKKDVPLGKRLLSFTPMFAIIIIGGAICCTYNYLRFDSIIEFGQSYQLTVADQRHLTYSSAKLLPTFFHFYLQGGKFYNSFPFISCTVMRYDFETTALAPYVNSYYGLLCVPLFWFTFLTPYAFHKNENKSLTWFGWFFPLFLFIFAFTTYSKAGICPRYLIEFYHLATIGSFFAILQLQEKVKSNSLEGFFHGSAYILLIVSAFICLCLSFDSFDGMVEGNMGGIRLFFKQIFNCYNI